MPDTYAHMPDGAYLKFPDGTKPEVMQKAVKTYLAKNAGASSATPAPTGKPPTASAFPAITPEKRAATKARIQSNLNASLKSQGITEQQARAQGVHPAVEAAKSGHANAQQAAQGDAVKQALRAADAYRFHGGALNPNQTQQRSQLDAAHNAQSRLQQASPDPGSFLNIIQPGFDHALAQQQGKKGAVRKMAGGLLNSVPDLALLAATEGGAEIPELFGHSLITRGFQAQQALGLAQSAGDSEMRKKDPGQYWTSLLLGAGLVAAPDLMKGTGRAITKHIDDVKSKQTTNVHGGPSLSAKDAATRDATAKVLAGKKARTEAGAKAKSAAAISRVKVAKPEPKPIEKTQEFPNSNHSDKTIKLPEEAQHKTVVKPADVPQVKPNGEPAPSVPPAEKAPSHPGGETVSDSLTPEHVKTHAKDGFTKAADLYAAAKKANPALTREEFAQRLYEFHKGDTHNYEGPSGNYKEADVFTAKSNDGRNIRYFGFSEKTSATPKEAPAAEPKTEPATSTVDRMKETAAAEMEAARARLAARKAQQAKQGSHSGMVDFGPPKEGSPADRFNKAVKKVTTPDEREANAVAKTSVNQIPALFSKIPVSAGQRNIDIGGGRFEKGTEYLAGRGIQSKVLDPYNRSEEHNVSVHDHYTQKPADTATVANVLNVIEDANIRQDVIRNAGKYVKPDGKIYFDMYEGNRSGAGAKTSTGTFQNNRKVASYLDEIRHVYPNARIEKGYIVAEKTASTVPTVKAVSEAVRTAAQERIAARKKEGHGGLGSLGGKYASDIFSNMADYAIIGASHIVDGLSDFGAWSSEMVKEFGAEINPHLQDIYKAAQAKHGEWVKQHAPVAESAPEVKPTEPPKEETAFKAPEVKTSPTQGHNTTNEMVNRARVSMGMGEVPAAQRKTWDAVSKHVEDTGMYHPEETVKVASRVLRGGHAMSQEEVVANNYRQHMIMHETADIRGQIDAGIKAGQDVTSLRFRNAFLEGEFETLTNATKRTGTLTSQALNIRKATLPKYDHNVVMQRLAHAKPGVEPTDAEKTEVAAAVKDLEKTKAKKKPSPDELRSKHAAAEAVREIRKGVRQGKKADLDTELKGHIERFLRATAQSNFNGLDPKLIPILKDIAVNRLGVAKLTAEQLVDQVHAAIDSHAELKGKFTKRQIQDGLSGYDQDPQAAKRSHFTDLKEEMKLLSEIEDTKNGVARERKVRQARQPSPEVARLRQERADLKAANKTPRPARKPKPPAKTELERRLDNQKARLNKQIENMDARIKAGDFSKDAKTPAPTDPETEALKARRDALKRIYDSLDPATEAKARAREARSAQRETAAEARKQKAADIRTKRNQIHRIENDLRGLDKASPWDVKETIGIRDNLRAQLKQANSELDAITTGPHRTADPLTAYKLKKQAEIDALDRQLANGKADPPKPEPFKLNRDREAEALDAEVKRKEQVIDNLIKKREGKEWQDKLIAYRRFAVLSRVGTLFKLGAAASERMIFSPLEEVTGLPAQLLTGKKVARNAPTQGGMSLRAEGAAARTFFTRKTWTKDAVDKLMTGHHDLDARLGKNDYDNGEKLGVLNFMGRLHGAIKTPAQLAAFERAQIKGTMWAERQGLDIKDPDVQANVDAMAYQESLRAILMQDNVAVGMYKGVINSLERYDHPAGKATATLMKAAMPIVKVPTNFAGEVGLHVAGGLRAAWEVAGAKLAGRDLSPEQCDIVLRSLKKQGVGGMMFALGYFNADKMGGTYVPGDKPHPQEYGSIKIGDWTIPHQFLHNPAIEAMQLGATFARTQKGGKVNSAYAVGIGMTESVPFLDFPKRAAEIYGSDKKMQKFAGAEIGGMIFPGAMNEAGGLFNKDAQGKQIRRKPQNFLDEMKSAAGLQSTLPRSNPSASRGGGISSALKIPKIKIPTIHIPK